jgi:hypothetical protein
MWGAEPPRGRAGSFRPAKIYRPSRGMLVFGNVVCCGFSSNGFRRCGLYEMRRPKASGLQNAAASPPHRAQEIRRTTAQSVPVERPLSRFFTVKSRLRNRATWGCAVGIGGKWRPFLNLPIFSRYVQGSIFGQSCVQRENAGLLNWQTHWGEQSAIGSE